MKRTPLVSRSVGTTLMTHPEKTKRLPGLATPPLAVHYLVPPSSLSRASLSALWVARSRIRSRPPIQSIYRSPSLQRVTPPCIDSSHPSGSTKVSHLLVLPASPAPPRRITPTSSQHTPCSRPSHHPRILLRHLHQHFRLVSLFLRLPKKSACFRQLVLPCLPSSIHSISSAPSHSSTEHEGSTSTSSSAPTDERPTNPTCSSESLSASVHASPTAPFTSPFTYYTFLSFRLSTFELNPYLQSLFPARSSSPAQARLQPRRPLVPDRDLQSSIRPSFPPRPYFHKRTHNNGRLKARDASR
jgi:hypothetical protein